MTDADNQNFWDLQNRLGDVADAVEKIADLDADYSLVAVDARANAVRVYRKAGGDVDRATVDSIYRQVVPVGVRLEFADSLLTAGEREAIIDSVNAFRGRLSSRGYRLHGVAGREIGGPIFISYLRAATPLTFELLTSLGVTEQWPADAITRSAVVLEMLDQATMKPWDALRPAWKA